MQHATNMQSILDQEIFDAKALLRRANGVSHEYLALEFALGEAESARTDERVDFMAEKIHVAHETMAIAHQDEYSAVSRVSLRRQADEFDEIDHFVEKRRRLNEWCIDNDKCSDLKSQNWADLIIPPPPEFEDPLLVPILIERALTPASMPAPMPTPHISVKPAMSVHLAVPWPSTVIL